MAVLSGALAKLQPREAFSVARHEYIADICSYDEGLKRHLVCAAFYFARLKLEIIPSKYLGCWVMADGVERRVSWQAKYYGEERGIVDDHSGEPYQRHDCPYCGGETEPIPVPRIAP